MRRYVIELLKASAMITGVACAVPAVLSLFVLHRHNGYMLLVMTAALALVMFGILMLPCIRFAAMIRRQERMGYPFEKGTPLLLSKGMTGTYLGDEWIIRAGYVALHHSQCAAARSESRSASRFGLHHRIVIETMDGRVYRWPLSQRKVRIVREWLKQKQAEA